MNRRFVEVFTKNGSSANASCFLAIAIKSLAVTGSLEHREASPKNDVQNVVQNVWKFIYKY